MVFVKNLEPIIYNAGYGASVEVLTYAELPHWICPDELKDVARFLKENVLK